MKKISFLFATLVAFSACTTIETRLSDTRMDADSEAMFSEGPPQSRQYAEPIGPSTYRIYNIFEMYDGRIVDLGTLDIAVGESIEREGPSDATFTRMQVEITGVEDDQLFLRSVWTDNDGQIVDSIESLPIRTQTAEPGDVQSGGKPTGAERSP